MGFTEGILKRFEKKKGKVLWGIALLGIFLSSFISYAWIVSILSIVLMSDKDLED